MDMRQRVSGEGRDNRRIFTQQAAAPEKNRKVGRPVTTGVRSLGAASEKLIDLISHGQNIVPNPCMPKHPFPNHTIIHDYE
jgi:hypothetical protein